MAKLERFFVGFADGRKEVGIGYEVFSKCPNGVTYREKIESFGNKYLKTDKGNQYEINDGSYKGQFASRRLWSSEEAYNQAADRDRYQMSFRRVVDDLGFRSQEITIEKFKKAAEALGLSEELEAEFKKGRKERKPW